MYPPGTYPASLRADNGQTPLLETEARIFAAKAPADLLAAERQRAGVGLGALSFSRAEQVSAGPAQAPPVTGGLGVAG